MEVFKAILAASAAPLLCLSAVAHSTTINFGTDPTPGPVAPGYDGFDWGTGANQAINSGVFGSSSWLYTTGPAATIVTFGRSKLFDLNSVDYQILVSGETGDGSFDNYTTVVSGYRGSTLVKSVTENYYSNGDDFFGGLNIDGVTSIRFKTTDTYGYLDDMGNPVISASNTPALTLVDELTVSKYVASAPELDPGSSASALILLIGGLAVLFGRRKGDRLVLIRR